MAAKKKTTTNNPPNQLVPLKIEGILWGAVYNEEGDLVAEEQMGQVKIFKANFDKVDQIVADAVAQALAGGSTPSE